MLRAENFDVTVGNLNINSISTKFDEFKLTVSGLFDVIWYQKENLMIHSEKRNFCIDGFFFLYRLDRDTNRNGGGFMIYIRDNVPSKMLGKHNQLLFSLISLNATGYCAQHIAHPPKTAITF